MKNRPSATVAEIPQNFCFLPLCLIFSYIKHQKLISNPAMDNKRPRIMLILHSSAEEKEDNEKRPNTTLDFIKSTCTKCGIFGVERFFAPCVWTLVQFSRLYRDASVWQDKTLIGFSHTNTHTRIYTHTCHCSDMWWSHSLQSWDAGELCKF